MAKKTTETTTKFKVDISELKKELRDANRAIMLTNSEFKNSVAGMDDWRDSADGVSAKITQLTDVNKNYNKILEEVSKRYEDVVEEEGEESESAQNLKIRMNNLEAAIKGNVTAIDKYTRQLSDMESESDTAKNTADDLSDSFEDNRTASQKLQDEIKDQKKQLNNLKTEYSDVALEQGKDSDAAKELQGKISLLNYELESNEKKLSDSAYAAENFSDNIKDADGLANNVSNATENLSDNIKKVDDTASNSASGGISSFKVALGNLAADGISAIIGALKDMVTELVNVEGAYDNFQIQTGASTAEMGKFQTQIDDIYKSGAGESIEDISSAMANVAQNTKEVDPSKIKDLTENAITLRDSFGFDVQESMRAVNMLMDQFGITGEEAFNLIVQGAQNGLNKNGDLLDSINEYSVHYKQLGYDADDFFNSLANGTEAGTFSVDKLGDAMKEFGIRTKDTATSTVEGFELLGYSSGVAAEEISKTQTEIEKLEKNLQYAQMEQEGFNEKTSELTRLKNADKIAEYSTALEDAKSRLSDLKSESNDSRGSIQALQDKFAEGGEAAQIATREVLTALFEMDDKVKQNQAGVDLFGTMWEDLGIEGVKALMDTNGELTASKESMEEITKIKYDNVTTEIASIGRTFKTDVLAPIVKKALPSIKKALEWVTDNLDEILDIAKPLGIALGTVFIGSKAASFAKSIKNIVGVVKTLTTVTKSQTVAQLALNATNPFGWVAIATVAIGGLIAAIASSTPTYDELVKKYSELDEEEQALRDTTDKLLESYDAFNDSKNNAISNTSGEFEYYDNLWDELQKIVDKNGEIKEGYEDRATVITGILSDALGIEMEITDGVIQKYDELGKSIEDVIALKEAESMLSALEGDYATAKQEIGKGEALQSYIDNRKTLEQQTRELSDAEKEYNDIRSDLLRSMGLTEESLTANGDAVMAYGREIKLTSTELDDAKAKVDGLTKIVNDQKEETNKTKDAYLGYISTIENYEGVSSSVISGDTDKINDSLLLLEHGFISAKNGTKDILEEQTRNYEVELENLEQAIKDGVPGVTQEQVDQMQELVDRSKAELDKFTPKAIAAGNMSMLEYVQTIKNNKIAAYDATSEVASEAEKGAKNIEPDLLGKWFCAGFADGIYADAWRVQNAAAAVSSGVDAMIRNIFGIASPSKVMKKYGGFITKGLAIGITGGIKDVVKSAKNMSGKTLSALKTDLNINGIASNLSGVASQLNGNADRIRNSGGIVNNYTFNQTNNSPKALSNFDIYRQSKNLLNAKGA